MPLCLAHHAGGLGAAPARLGGVVHREGSGGGAQRVLGMEVGGDDLRGELSLGGVLRQIVRDRGHGAFVAAGAPRAWRWRVTGGGAKLGVDLAGERIGKVWDDEHDGGASFAAGERRGDGS